jgi:hypothetical protein
MSLSRRGFLKRAAIGVGAASVPGAWAQIAAGQSGARQAFSSDLSGQTSMQLFAAQTGTRFEVFGDSRAILTLASVDDLRNPADSSYPQSGSRESFQLVFSGTGAPLAEGTHNFSHPVLGKMKIFISPSGIENGKRLYQAQFNRL